MITAKQFVNQALTGNYIGILYSELDCQALLERIMKDCGEKHDWRGSNHMWRDALSEKHIISNEMDIPAGAWLFTVKHDGGEKERGYNDAEGNACHVGAYLGFSRVMHSTTGGVQWDDISRSRWTHWGLCKYIDYSTPAIDTAENTAYYNKRNQYTDLQKEKAPENAAPSRVVKMINVSDLTDDEINEILSSVLGGADQWTK